MRVERRRLHRRTLLGGSLLLGQALGTARASEQRELSPPAGRTLDELWEATLALYLSGDYWLPDAYDAGHLLMVPLHAAFGTGRDAWCRAYGVQAARVAEVLTADGSAIENRLTRLQFLYVWSRFGALAVSTGADELLPARLVELLRSEVRRVWTDEPAWQWARDEFPGGMRERVLWKLDQTEVEFSYYRAVIDEELYTIAIAADLLAMGQTDEMVEDVVTVGDRVFAQEGVDQSAGGWLFQPGVWSDHPDYAYAGNAEVKPDLERNVVEGIAWDISHSHRMPRWLRSLLEARPADDQRIAFYSEVLARLERQFIDVALVAPSTEFPGYRTTNFLDGRNGVYRWDYPTTPNDGYGPFELSGTLCLGWWAFLGTARSQAMFRDLSGRFPLVPDVVTLYTGPNTTRPRHPLAAWPGYLENGFAELVVRLAADIPADVHSARTVGQVTKLSPERPSP